MKICIYHGNCSDGFGSAWVVRMAHPKETIEYYPGFYQNPPPDVTGKDVIMVDFSYKRPVLLEMAKQAKSILIIDHHKTAQEDLVDLPDNVKCVFDMEHSGVILTWKYYFKDEPAYTLLHHIEDRDLWKFKLENTRLIQACVFSYPYDFDVWDRLMRMDLSALAKEGEAIERKHFKDIKELLSVSTRLMYIGGYSVKVANIPYTMSSDAAHELDQGMPFGACYYDSPKGRVFSLRSNENGIDVSQVAKQYGGGGHKHAAGFTVPYDVAATFEVK